MSERAPVGRRRAFVAVLSSCLAGCAPDDLSPSTGQAPPAIAPGAPASEPALLAIRREEGISMPRPYRDRGQAAVSLNAACLSCHHEEAADWRGSRHRQSYTNAAFQAALAVEPTAFCRGCHAPESDPKKAPPAAVSDIGVGCVTCHVTEEGTVLAAARAGPEEDRAPHPIRRSTDFARTGACAGCHEFPFPGAHGDGDHELMQTTLREHADSRAASQPCADCHMPSRAGRRSHAFSSVRDPAWLRSQLQVTAERAGDGRVRIELSQPAPGHAFPTGDLFRRLEVGGELRDAGGNVIARDVRHLARHFELVPGKRDRQLVRDDRVFDDPAVVDLALSPSQPGATVRWWVTYQRVATVGIGKDPAGAKLESEVPLHGGVLVWRGD